MMMMLMIAFSSCVMLQCLLNRRLADEKQRQQRQTLSGSSVSTTDVLAADVQRELALVSH